MRHRDSRWDDYGRSIYHYDDRWYQQKRDRYPTSHSYNVGQSHRNSRSYSASDVAYGGYDRRYRPSSAHGYGYDSRDHPPRYNDSYPNDSYTVPLDGAHAARATNAVKRFRENPRELTPPPVATRVPLDRKPTNNGLVTREPSTVAMRAISSDVASRKAPTSVVRRLPDTISKTSSATTSATENNEVMVPRLSSAKGQAVIQRVKTAVVHAKPLTKLETPEKPPVVNKTPSSTIVTRSTTVKSGGKVALGQQSELSETSVNIPITRRSNKHIPKAGSPIRVENTKVPLKRTARASSVVQEVDVLPEASIVTRVPVANTGTITSDGAIKTRNIGDRIKSRLNAQPVGATESDAETFVDAAEGFHSEDDSMVAGVDPHSLQQTQLVQDLHGIKVAQQVEKIPDTPLTRRKGARKLTASSLASESTNVGSSATDVSDAGEASKKRVSRVSKSRVLETYEKYDVVEASILEPSVETVTGEPLKNLKRTQGLKIVKSEKADLVTTNDTLEAPKKTKRAAASLASTRSRRVKRTSNDSLVKDSTRAILCKKYTRQAHDDYEADLRRAIEISMLETTINQGESGVGTLESCDLVATPKLDESVFGDHLHNASTNTSEEIDVDTVSGVVGVGIKGNSFIGGPNGDSTLALPNVDLDGDADADVEGEGEVDGNGDIGIEGVDKKIVKRRGPKGTKGRKGSGAVKTIRSAGVLCSKRMQAVEEYLDWCERSYCGKSILDGSNTTSGYFGISNLAPEFGNVLDLLTCKFRQPHVLDLWGPKELVTFELALFKYGKEFSEIQRLIPTKSVPEIVDLYYLWKKTARYNLWKANRIY